MGGAPRTASHAAADAGRTRQRDFAFRRGVGIVIYTLTVISEPTKVHAPALLERLGQ